MSENSESSVPSRVYLWLTLSIAVLVALVSAVGLAVPGFYRGPLTWTVQGTAQDLVDLVVVLPALVISGWLAYRGSRRALLVWLGSLTYLVYTFVIYAFGVYFNALFLVYVAILGCCLWALIGGMATTRWDEIRAQFTGNTPVKFVSVLMLLQAVFFYLGWLKEDIPAVIAGIVPQSVQEIGLATNPVHVLDMAMLLPAIAISAIWLWRRQTLGYGLAALLLTNLTFQGINVATVMVFAVRAGLPGGAGPVGMFVALAALDLALLAWHLWTMKSASRPVLRQAMAPH